MIKLYTENLNEVIARLHRANVILDETVLANMAAMRQRIANEGDVAVIDYTRQFDHIQSDNFTLTVSRTEIERAYEQVPQSVINALNAAIKNIKKFHTLQMPKSWLRTPKTGIKYGCRYTPISAVGLYVPGGRAPYPTTVLMNAIPAVIAGVEKIVLVTPPRPDGTIDPAILVAADLCGITTICRVGGAQAVFALSYGTASIPKVDKIVGPGNMYVQTAKQMVYGLVDIDKPAGPSEVLIYLKDKKYAAYAAADMLAQLEHDPVSVAIAIADKVTVLDKIRDEIDRLLPGCSRAEVLHQSIQNAALFLVRDDDMAVDVINQIASEHLILMLNNPNAVLNRVKHAGAIFLGPYSPVTLGDYYAGPNHVLPTSGTARFASPLGVMDFMKYSSVLSYSQEQLMGVSTDLDILTGVEGFDAHNLAVKVRRNSDGRE